MDLIGNKNRILFSFSDIHNAIETKGGKPTNVLSYSGAIRSLTIDTKFVLIGQSYNGNQSAKSINLNSVGFTLTTIGQEYFYSSSSTSGYSNICKKECDILVIGATFSRGSATSSNCGIVINGTTYNFNNYYSLRCKNFHINVNDSVKSYASITQPSSDYIIALEQIYLISKD